MPAAGTASSVARFDAFEVDLQAGRLHKRGVRIHLREKSFQVLAYLLGHPGEIVTREELRSRLWPQDVFVDFDHNLNTAVARLREALRDSAEHPRYIETLPKRGYRFIGNLTEPAIQSQPQAAARTRVLVLPFINLSNDPAQEYFSDAMTEDITTMLAGLSPEHLAVLARTTAMHYKGAGDVARIGRELDVQYVIEGSVRRDSERLTINVQLIESAGQSHRWAKRYDAALGDVFVTQMAIAQAIAEQFNPTSQASGDAHPARRVPRKPTEDLVAYNLFIQGRYHRHEWTSDGLTKARECFEQAIARDPSFALAYDALAELIWYVAFLGFAPAKEAFSAGVFVALRAVEIDNTLGETHALLGMYRKELDYNWAEVQREMAIGLELNPDSPVVRFRYALSGLMPSGRLTEAIAELHRALEIDPLSLDMRCWLGEMFDLDRQYDRGLGEIRQVLELNPADYMAHFFAGFLYRDKGMLTEAATSLRRAAELSGGAVLIQGWLGQVLALGGDFSGAREIQNRLRAMASDVYVPPSSFAWIHLALGETDSAFEWLDRAVDARDPMIIPIKSYAFLDPIRQDARYFALLRRMNLEP